MTKGEISRRYVLKVWSGLLSVVLLGPRLLGVREAEAQQKASQQQVQYQGTPKNKQECSICLQFVEKDSSCKLVAGKISPKGWCLLFAPKPAK